MRAAFERACFGAPAFADVIVVLTGDGETRLEAALAMYSHHVRMDPAHPPLVCISGGVYDPPYAIDAARMGMSLVGHGLSRDRMVLEDESQHTRDSAEKVLDLAVTNQWARILLVTSSYHLPRAVLSFVAVLNERDLAETIRLIPLSAPSKMFEIAPGTGVRRIDLVGREASKVAEYQAKGDVASYEDGLAYLEYWETHL